MTMTSKINLILALQQVENISNLMQGNEYEAYFNHRLITMKYELERQIALKNNGKETV